METRTIRRALAATATLLVLAGGGSAALPAGTATLHPPADPTPGTAQGTEVLAGSSAHRTGAKRTTARWSGSVNTNSAGAVNAAYVNGYASGLTVNTGYTGNDSRCVAGSSSAASRGATLRAINFVRSMNGLAPVTFSSSLNWRSQLTALMMSANRSLSHAPPRSWRCYTATGAANAGRSNLALAYPSLSSAGLVGLYMSEPGSNNRAVGHRRWLLNPFTTQMGSGSTVAANAITVIGPTAASRPNPSWVSWPSAGYFPDALEPAGRWSLSSGLSTIDFRYAAVRVYRNGVLLRTVKNAVENGYAQPTLVWQVPANVARSGSFKVVVSGIRRAGTSTRYTRTYAVRMFTPSR